MFSHICHDRKGSTAVEFALVAIPFMWLLIGMVELALYFTSSSLLAEATSVGARLVRTGQLEGSSGAEQAFKDAVCDRAAVFIPCPEIQFQVLPVTGDNFANATAASFDDEGNLTGQGYNDGQQSSVIMVRVAYRYPFMTPLLGSVLADGGNNSRLIMNTIVMKNEPYDS